MSKHIVITVGIPADVKHTWLPGCHPMNADGSPAKRVPGIQIPIGKPTEIEAVDDRHLALLKSNHLLKFLEPAKEASEEPKPNGADPSEVQAEAPKEAPKADKKPKDKPKG